MKKSYGLLIVLSACVQFYNAKGQALQWRQQFSGNAPSNFSYSNDMVTDANGNTYVVGSFFGSINFGLGTISSIGPQSAYIAKYHPTGALLYLKRIGNPNFGELSARGVTLHTASDGTVFIYVTGYHSSYTGQILTTDFNIDGGTGAVNLSMNDNLGDQFVAKYEVAFGNCVWAKAVPDTNTASGDNNGPKITTDNLGNAYLINNFATKVYKFNSAGTQVWNQSVGSPGVSASNIEFKNDKVFVCGAGLGPNQQPIIWLDVNGNFIAGTGDLYSFASISVDNTNNDIYVAGSRDIAGGLREMAVRKYHFSPNGGPVWSKVFTSNLSSTAIDVTIAKHAPSNLNEVVVAGWFKGIVNFNNWVNTNFTVTSSGNGIHSNIFVARYNTSNGQCAWVRNNTSNTQIGQSNPIAVSSFTNNFHVSGNVLYRTIDADFCAGTSNVSADNAENGYIAKYLITQSNPVLTNPTIVCTSGASFVVSNLGAGATATWSVSPSNLFVTSSGTGSTAFLQAKPGFSGSATITFTLNGIDGCGIPLPSTISRTFWTGPPLGGISGPSVVYPQQNYFYANGTPTNLDGGFNYQWAIYGGTFNGINYNNAIAFWNESGTIVLDYENVCGTVSSEMEVTVDLGGGGGCDPCQRMQSYPNPVSSDLKIKFTSNENYPEKATKEVTLIDKNQKSVYHVLTQKNEIEISTTALPDGEYFLKVKGVKEVDTKRIFVKH